jgi:hypothetical protein
MGRKSKAFFKSTIVLWLIIARLGAGAYGRVYLAIDSLPSVKTAVNRPRCVESFCWFYIEHSSMLSITLTVLLHVLRIYPELLSLLVCRWRLLHPGFSLFLAQDTQDVRRLCFFTGAM